MKGERACLEEVIVLRVIQHGDHNLILKTISKKGGLLSFFARSAKKSKKRFASGVLSATHFLKVSYRKNQKGELYPLEEAFLIYDFPKLRTDYDKISLSFYFLKAAAGVARENAVDNAKLFDLLGNALKALEDSENLQVIYHQFVLKVLAQQGVLPQNLQSSEYLRWTFMDHSKISKKISRDASAKLGQLSREYMGLESYSFLDS